MNSYPFQYEFEFNNEWYMADIRHYEDLSLEERILHSIKENTFLVHLFSVSGTKSFEMFIEAGDFEMRWQTNSLLFVHPRIVEIIGNKIEDISLNH